MLYTHDEFGNQNASYTLGAWDKTGEQKMGDQDVTINAAWTAAEVEVPEWKITYSWTGDVPEGTYAQVLPTDNKNYKNNEPYAVDTKYTNKYTVTTYDAYGNATESMPSADGIRKMETSRKI